MTGEKPNVRLRRPGPPTARGTGSTPTRQDGHDSRRIACTKTTGIPHGGTKPDRRGTAMSRPGLGKPPSEHFFAAVGLRPGIRPDRPGATPGRVDIPANALAKRPPAVVPAIRRRPGSRLRPPAERSGPGASRRDKCRRFPLRRAVRLGRDAGVPLLDDDARTDPGAEAETGVPVRRRGGASGGRDPAGGRVRTDRVRNDHRPQSIRSVRTIRSHRRRPRPGAFGAATVRRRAAPSRRRWSLCP